LAKKTVEVTPKANPTFVSGEIKERYEALREDVINRRKSSHKWGLALFIHRGMMGWMKAWLIYTPQAKCLDSEPSYKEENVSQDIRGSIVIALANMILSGRMGGRP
jgi:hypothetical protein